MMPVIIEIDNEEFGLPERPATKKLKERVEELIYFRDTHVGLWATDRPDLVNDLCKVMFQIKKDEQPHDLPAWTETKTYKDGDTVIINGKRGVIHTENWENE
jgi:hypothetical protein